MEVMPSRNQYQLAPFVYYDDYDNTGYLLDIRHGMLHELNEQETSLLSAVLFSSIRGETIHPLSPQCEREGLSPLLERLQRHQLLVPRTRCSTLDSPPGASFPLSDMTSRQREETKRGESCPAISLRRRFIGAGHMIAVLNELRQGEEGLYRAYLYIQKLRALYLTGNTQHVLSEESAFQLARQEYWFYRLITGLLERRVAHLLGQRSGEEGLCMVKTFPLCAYLLTLRLPAQIVLARPLYGSRSGYRLHVWGEMYGKPLNEVANIRKRYRVITTFPSYA